MLNGTPALLLMEFVNLHKHMENKNLSDKLFISASEKYGEKYIEHLLDQYRLYVNAAEKISDRRQKTNEFFLGLNTALIGLLGFMMTKTGSKENSLILFIASVAGAIMCYLWYRIITSYKGLNSAKYKVIHTIEERLPLALYDTEWEALGRGNDKTKYWPFSHIEQYVPWIFIVLYWILLLSMVTWTKVLLFLLCLLSYRGV